MTRFWRIGAALAVALLASGCEQPPDETQIQAAIERLQQVWAERQRRERGDQQSAAAPRVRPDLAFDAGLHLRIRSVRIIGCRDAPEVQGWHCTMDVTAESGGGEPVTRTLHGRFIRAAGNWVARDVQPLQPQQVVR
jgi:hypothetical protein